MKSFPARKVPCFWRGADYCPKDNGKAGVWYTLALVTGEETKNFYLLMEDIKSREESI